MSSFPFACSFPSLPHFSFHPFLSLTSFLIFHPLTISKQLSSTFHSLHISHFFPLSLLIPLFLPTLPSFFSLCSFYLLVLSTFSLHPSFSTSFPFPGFPSPSHLSSLFLIIALILLPSPTSSETPFSFFFPTFFQTCLQPCLIPLPLHYFNTVDIICELLSQKLSPLRIVLGWETKVVE